MTYDYFIAARFRNKDAALDCARRIRETSATVYCFAESDASREEVGAVDSDAETAMRQFEAKDWRTDPSVRRVFDTDMAALRESRTVIVLLPAGKSAHIEAGVAYGLGKRLILIGEQKEAESLYCIFDIVYPSVDAFLHTL